MKKIISIIMCLALAACSGTRNNNGEIVMQPVTDAQQTALIQTAGQMTQSMLNQDTLKQDNTVLLIGNFENETNKKFDTNAVSKEIRTTLLKSSPLQIAVSFKNEGNFQTILLPSNIKAGTRVQTPSGAIIAITGAASKPAEETPEKTNELVEPNTLLSGNIFSKEIKVKSGWFSSKYYNEDYLQLTLTDLTNNSIIWQDEQQITYTTEN